VPSTQKQKGQATLSAYLPGDYVKKGTLLARVENPGFVAQQRLLLETKTSMEAAWKDFERKKALKTGSAVPEKEYDKSKYEYELLSVRYEGLKREMELLGIDVQSLEAEKKFQPAINVYARQSGYIQDISIHNGQRVSPETQLMTIAETGHLHLALEVLSKDIGAIKTGQEVEFSLPGQEGAFRAKISKINPMLEKDRSSLSIHCDIEEANTSLLVPGLFANAIIYSASQALEGLPLGGVVKEGEDYYAFKITGEKVEKLHLHVTQIMEDFVVFEGPKEGEWVVDGGYYVE
jgi:cobalt-zinc-cadmium efflux system membrane fusion protein